MTWKRVTPQKSGLLGSPADKGETESRHLEEVLPTLRERQLEVPE